MLQNSCISVVDYLGMETCDQCGPDVTQALSNTMDLFKSEWSKLSFLRRKKICFYVFFNPASIYDGWDIKGLVEGDHSPAKAAAKCGEERSEGTNKCFKTVRVDGGCHYRWSVNYILYGAAAKFCDINPNRLLERFLAYSVPKDIYEGTSQTPDKLLWMLAGYRGWSPGKSPNGPSKYSSCKACKVPAAVSVYQGRVGSLKWDENGNVY